MPELPELAEMRAAWLNQPGEVPVDVEQTYRRRTWELFSATRSEVMSSIGAALFLAGVVAWRFAPERDRLVQFGCAAAIIWATLTLFWFRSSIRRNKFQPDFFARTGLDHYRMELSRRRAHLRSVWIWHGPLWMASILSLATLTGRIVPGRLWDALPVLVLLAGWVAIGVKRRLRQAAELQEEIDEHSSESPMEV